MRPILLTLLLIIPATAVAQKRTAPPRLSDLEQGQVLLLAHKGRLEARLADQVRRIGRLKQNNAGVGREFQLEAALRQNRQLSEKLSKLQQRINASSRALVTAYEAHLARENLPANQRKSLTARLASLRMMLKGPGSRLVTSGEVSAMDSPEDLEEKADLLDDSREKLERRLDRVRKQLKQLRHRKRLRRHGQAADDTPFDESSTSRTVTVRGSSSERADDTSATNKRGGGSHYQGPGNNGNPAPGKPPQPPATGLSGAARDNEAGPSSAGALSGLSLQETMSDAEFLRSLGRTARGGKSLEQQIAQLEQAQGKLNKVLKEMGSRSKKLRDQAKKVRQAK